jgi:hypothetical protein
MRDRLASLAAPPADAARVMHTVLDYVPVVIPPERAKIEVVPHDA